MKITCDGCGQSVEDGLCQMLQEGKEILYLCPDCFLKRQGTPPDEQP